MWEYEIIEEPVSPFGGSSSVEETRGFMQRLDEMGAKGWELVHVSYSLRTYFFKRPRTIGR